MTTSASAPWRRRKPAIVSISSGSTATSLTATPAAGGNVVAVKIHRGKTLFVSAEAAALADPICRAEISRMEAADEGWSMLLRHLGNMGPSLAEDVQRELDLKPKELKAIRAPLERCGALVARFFPAAGDWLTELVRWDQLRPEPSPAGGLAELVVAGVRAAVICREEE